MNRFPLYIILAFLLHLNTGWAQEDSTRYVVFAGYYHNEIDTSNKSVRIKVENYDTGEQYGTFISNSKTGFFVIVLPPGNQYKYTILPNGSDIPHYALIQPKESSGELIHAMKQEIRLIKDDSDEEAMVIRNLFDQEFSEMEDKIILLSVFGE
ncbi:MAG: hypothetical protein HUJ25_16350 [Crocinitomicaceae bacterium]|nr:hypothetical protein [Crocinitomicaceae bacterium]